MTPIIQKTMTVKTRLIYALFLAGAVLGSCKKDETKAELPMPTAQNIEIGTGNNKHALRGRDFHLNADVLAGDKIQDVQVKILQKSGETYTANWRLEMSWPEFKGGKNTNVHKHFTIPADAPEGKYDFYFIVIDENGTKLEIKVDFSILDPANVPVDPKIGRDIFSRNGTMIYYTDTFVEKELIFKKGDEFTAHAQVSDIKGNGILYTVLIKRKASYFPESIDNLDFSKAIVISKGEHRDLPAASKITTLKQINGAYGGESIIIGAANDGNEPSPMPITGAKAWESGQYNLVILYKNTTYNVSVFKSIPITIGYH